MDESIFCEKCGNMHCGSCSTEAIYFYWYPEANETAKEVYIIGDWTKWQRRELMSIKQCNNKKTYFTICLILSPGRHQYKFIVDGLWRYNPNNPKLENNFGSYNNIVEIWPKKTYIQKYPNCEVKLSSNFLVENLKITGSWDDWTLQRTMNKTFNNLKGTEQNIIYLNLEADKTYEFKLKIGNQYLVDENYPTVINMYGTLNNYIMVYEKIIRVQNSEKKKMEDIQSEGKRQINGKIFRWKKIVCNENIPYERVEGHTICSVGEYIYMFGGKSRSEFYNSLIKVDSKFDKIQSQDIVPDGRAFHNMQVYGNKIIIYGGHNNIILGDYHTFNVVQRKWESTPIFNQQEVKFQKQSCVIYENLLIFFGGHNYTYTEENSILSNELTVLNLQKMQWIDHIHILGQRPKGRFSHTGVIISSEMYIFGGISSYSNKQILNENDLWKINLKDVNQLNWQKIVPKGTAPSARHGHTMSVLENIFIIFGGMNDKNQLLNDLIVFNTIRNQWISPIIQGRMPAPRFNHASTNFINDQIIIFGGKTQNNSKNKYFYVLRPQSLIGSFEQNDEDEDYTN